MGPEVFILYEPVRTPPHRGHRPQQCPMSGEPMTEQGEQSARVQAKRKSAESLQTRIKPGSHLLSPCASSCKQCQG